MNPENARPFDPHNRPLKGEWVLLDLEDNTVATAPPMGDAEVGYTQAIDVIKRGVPAKKPFPLGLAVIVGLVVAAIVFFVLNRGMFSGDRPRTAATRTTNTDDIAKNGTPSSGAPILALDSGAQSDDGSKRKYILNVNLNREGASLEPTRPLDYSIEGGKLVSQQYKDGKITLVVDRTGRGRLDVKSLRWVGDHINPSPPEVDKIEWTAANGGNR